MCYIYFTGMLAHDANLVCNRGDTIQYHGGFQSRELGQDDANLRS